MEENPFEAEFNGEYDIDDDDEEDVDGTLDFTPPITDAEIINNNFSVLNSSLPPSEQQSHEQPTEQQHHLASFASAKRSGAKDKKHRTKWHFGIRSRSPPMEVMLEIYRTLKALGMEWKEKRTLGGLGGVRRSGEVGAGGKLVRAQELDGEGSFDSRAAMQIYFVETRARVQDVVVRGFVSSIVFVSIYFNLLRIICDTL